MTARTPNEILDTLTSTDVEQLLRNDAMGASGLAYWALEVTRSKDIEEAMSNATSLAGAAHDMLLIHVRELAKLEGWKDPDPDQLNELMARSGLVKLTESDDA